MTFTSLEFPLFFLVVLLLQRFARGVSMKIWVLLLASYTFYMSGSVAGVLLIAAMSAIDFHVGKAIAATDVPSARKRWLVLSLVSNLGILAFFKYTNFLLENVQVALNALQVSLSLPRVDIAPPPGVSYFTFTSLSYVLDIYYERIDPTRRASEYLLYIAYFPKLLAGPIVRAGDFLSQVGKRFASSAADVEIGVAYFLIGAVKKVVIADQLSPHVDLIFSAPAQYNGLTLLQGLLGYTVQIYCDFSGYSDMAIGCARIMGIRLPENFAMPYSAVSITEFWRRWHITLSNWFRDYIFIPLEMATKGNPYVSARVSMNLFVTMALCGLWHGASWNFVFWGGLHGVSLAINRAWRTSRAVGARGASPAISIVSTLFSRALTLGVVMVGWIFFRAESWTSAVQYLVGILTWRQNALQVLSPYIIAAVVVVFVAHLVLDKDHNWAQELPQWPVPARVVSYSALVFLLSVMAAGETRPFLYFQF